MTTKRDYSGLVGKDELGMSHLLGFYKPVSLTEEDRRRVQEWTKYQLAGERRECKCRVDADLDIVAVRVGDLVRCVMRSLRERVELDGGRTFIEYDILAVYAVGTGDSAQEEALEHIRDLQSQVDINLARQIEGFGDGDVLQDALDDASKHPLAPLVDAEDDPVDEPSEIEAMMGAVSVYGD